MDAQVGKSEMDALNQAIGSGKMDGKEVVGRKIAKDGKSGMIQFGNPNGEKEMWTPKFVVNDRQLRKLYTTEDYVLVYFFSTANDDDMSQSHTSGKPFEEAAQELLEGENEVSLVMLDMAKCRCDDALREIGVTRPHSYRLFVNGKPKEYRGPREPKGIVAFMNQYTGGATVKLDSAEALDAVLDSASAVTNVVGIFGPAYEGSSSRQIFADAARDLREPGRLQFYEVSTYVARNAKRFSGEAFEASESAFAVVRPAKWVSKAEKQYAVTTDFRSVHRFVNEHCWPTIAPLSEQFVTHASQVLKKTHMAVLIVDTRAHAKFMRYVTKQLYKLLDDADVGSAFSLAVAERKPRLDNFIMQRFDRTTIDRTFYQGAKFEDEYVKDFTLVIFDLLDVPPPEDPDHPDYSKEPGPPTTRNWVTNALVGSTADALDVTKLLPYLKAVAGGDVPPLAQGSAAAPAAGLKEMKMGFGGPDEADEPKPKKKKKKAKAAANDGLKDDL